MSYADELKKKYPIGQRFDVSGFRFIISSKYARDRYKVKLLESCKLDFTGNTFTIGFVKYIFTKKTGTKSYVIKELKK